jgi:hypothetical protein
MHSLGASLRYRFDARNHEVLHVDALGLGPRAAAKVSFRTIECQRLAVRRELQAEAWEV